VAVTGLKQLRKFLGWTAAQHGCELFLPKFRCGAKLTDPKEEDSSFRYPGSTFSERDTRAAFHVSSLISNIVDSERIHLKDSSSFLPEKAKAKVCFVFGSRSNRAAIWVAEHLARDNFFHFKFGRFWKIHCVNSDVYSIPDPSTLDVESYIGTTDYGVIGRFSEPKTHIKFFLIAGLGDCATEGSGLYLARHWQGLFQRFGTRDFAVVLRFPPPVSPQRCKPVAWLAQP